MEPVSLAQIKVHLKMDPAASDEDTALESMIVAARHACELRTRRTIIGETRVLALRAFPAANTTLLGVLGGASMRARIAGDNEIALPGGTVASAEVRYYDGNGIDQVLATNAYRTVLTTSPALLQPVNDWPVAQARPDAVRVTYTLSPLDGGKLDMVRSAIKLIVEAWYDGCGAQGALPRSVDWLLNPLTVFGD